MCVRDREEEMGAPLITATITARVESFFFLFFFIFPISPSFLLSAPCPLSASSLSLVLPLLRFLLSILLCFLFYRFLGLFCFYFFFPDRTRIVSIPYPLRGSGFVAANRFD